MSRTSLGVMAALAAVVVAVAVMLLHEPQGDIGGGGLDRQAQTDAPRTELPVTRLEEPAVPLAGEAETLAPAETGIEPPPPEEFVPDALRVAITHAHGEPARGGMLVLFDEAGQEVDDGVLNVDGEWTSAGVDGPAELFVTGITRSHQRFELERGLGEHELVLDEGAWLSGSVIINGQAPANPFPLKIEGVASLDELFGDRKGRPARAAVRGELSNSQYAGFLTDEAGRFVVSGFQQGEQVTLSWGGNYDVADGYTDPFPVTVPASDVLLFLKRPYFVHGRVIHPDGSPAPEAEITIRVKVNRETERGASSHSRTYDDKHPAPDGRFMVAVDELSEIRFRDESTRPMGGYVTVDADVVVTAPGGLVAKALLEGGVPGQDHDLGALILQPSANVPVRVVDATGAPVPGARVRPESLRNPLGALTADEDGLVDVDLDVADAGCVTVVAEGFRTQRAMLPPTPSSTPYDVVVYPATTVVLKAVGPWGEDAYPFDGWAYDFSVMAMDSPWHDYELPPIPGSDSGPRSSSDPMRPRPEGFKGSSGSSTYGDGTKKQTLGMRLPAVRYEGLRAGHAVRFEITVTGAPEEYRPLGDEAVWESDELILADGEVREVIADFRNLRPGG
jgi:hypothetical protein